MRAAIYEEIERIVVKDIPTPGHYYIIAENGKGSLSSYVKSILVQDFGISSIQKLEENRYIVFGIVELSRKIEKWSQKN